MEKQEFYNEIIALRRTKTAPLTLDATIGAVKNLLKTYFSSQGQDAVYITKRNFFMIGGIQYDMDDDTFDSVETYLKDQGFDVTRDDVHQNLTVRL